MGCGSSVLGCCPEREPSAASQQPRSRPTKHQEATPAGGGGGTTPAATAAAGLSPPRLRPLSLQRDGSRRPAGLEPEAPVGAAAAASGVAARLVTEELGSGRSQLERGYQQLPLGVPLKEWDDLHVRMWLLTLPPVLRPYTDMLCSPGGLLMEWSDELLSEAGVSNAFHRRQLLEYVRQLQHDVTSRIQQQEPAPAGALPGSIDSPRGGSGGGGGGDGDGAQHELFGGVQRQKSQGGGGGGGGLRESDPGLGSLTPARCASLRRLRLRSGGGSGSDEDEGGGEGDGGDGGKGGAGGRKPSSPSSKGAGGGRAAVADPRMSTEGVGRLVDYEQGLLEQGVATLKLLVREAGSMCPWPGDAAASLLGSLLDMGERAIINRRNWQQLNARAVDLLQLIAANKRLQSDTHTYRALMHRLMNTLKGIREYFTDYTNRNWLSRIVGVGRDQHMFNQLWNALGALVSDASFGLQAAAASGQEAATAALERLQKRQAQYDDEEGRLRSRIDELGGVDALCRDPGALAAVAERLGVGARLTLHKIQEAVGLLEADRSEGVHSLIPHPELRVLWRKCFAGCQDVGWALWWEAFPAELARVPVEGLVIATLSSRLSDPSRRSAFERRLDLSAGGRISVVDLRRTVPAEADLREAVAQLTERLSLDGRGEPPAATPASAPAAGDTTTAAATAAAASAATSGASARSSSSALSAGTAGGAAVAEPRPPAPPPLPPPPPPSSPAPYTALEPRCCLPPLDCDRFVGREEDVRQVSQILMAGSGAPPSLPLPPPRFHRRGGSDDAAVQGSDVDASGGSGGGGGGGGGARRLSVSVNRRPHAVCVVGESGMGKSALAVAAARRLWETGALPGGAYHVELQGADCRAEMAARFAGALGLAKAEHGDAGGTSGVSLALQALAARGPLLLVLDGVDCLEPELYDNSFGSPEDAGADSESTPSLNETADIDVQTTTRHHHHLNNPEGGGGGGLGAGLDSEPEAALSELLAVVPAARVLLTSTEPLELRSREVEYWWLGPLPEPAGVALVQDLARCLSWDEARQLVAACGLSPLALRLAASAVATGALTLRDAVARARNAAALAAFTPRGGWSPVGGGPGGGGGGFSPTASGGATGGQGSVPGSVPGSVGAPGRGVGPSGPSILMPTTPRLLRSQSPLAAPPYRYRSPQTPPGRSAAAARAAAAQPPYGFMQYYADGSTAGDSPGPSGGGTGTGTGGIYGTPSSALTPSPSNIRNPRANNSFARSMSFLLRTSQTTGGAAMGVAGPAGAATGSGSGSGLPPPPPLLRPTSSGRAGSGASGRTYGSGAAVAAALLAALNDEHRTALVQLSIMPGSWDEDTASALLGQPPYAVRALLDVLVGYSLVVNRGGGGVRGGGVRSSGMRISSGGGLNATMGGGSGCYSLMPGVLDAARGLLAELDTESRVALQCRFVGHVLAQFLRADRLYREGAVRAATQLASELRQDVQAMLLLAARCPDTERMLWGTLGASRLPALASSALFAALALDASGEMDAFWRAVGEAAQQAAQKARTAAAAATSAAENAAPESAAAATGPSPGSVRGFEAVAALAARALAQTLHKQARYEEAEAVWRDALSREGRIHGPSSLEAAACHSGLGLALSALRRYGEAEEQHRAALGLRKTALGDRHVDVATSLSDVARVMRNTGRYRQAEEAYGEVLQVRRELLGEDHPAVADTYTSAGIAAGLQKRYMEEEHFYKKALAIRQRTLGPDHPEVAQALNNIGTALSSQGKHAAAEQVFREALAIKRRVLGPGHHAVGTTLNNIARALRYQGRLPEAETACRGALSVLEGSLGATHPSVTTALSNLVFLLKRQGKEAEAAAVAQAYRPRWTHDHHPPLQVQQQQQPGQQVSSPGQDTAAAAPAPGLAGVAAGSATASPPPPRLGKPPLAPLAPQGSARTQVPAVSPPPLPRKPLVGQGQVPKPGQSALDAGGCGAGGGVCDDLAAGPPELSSRLDASSLHRAVLVEAARAAQRELQAGEQRKSGSSNLGLRTSGPHDGRTSTGSTTLVTEFVARASAASSGIQESISGGSAAAASIQELLSTNGTLATTIRASGAVPPPS